MFIRYVHVHNQRSKYLSEIISVYPQGGGPDGPTWFSRRI